ncbi:Uncharacterized protein Rs2_39776 [Raphanus sativus]|nr:Uncharacterized protein Rs2_39776 [Raphanus sativus]
MNTNPSKSIFFLLALILTALVFQQSEVAAKMKYCSAIDKEPGCHDSLKLAAANDFRWLGKDCCKVVYSISEPCFLDVLHNIRHSLWSGGEGVPWIPKGPEFEFCTTPDFHNA